MMEIYEVLNQVHSEEEYMEFPEMETAACTLRIHAAVSISGNSCMYPEGTDEAS